MKKKHRSLVQNIVLTTAVSCTAGHFHDIVTTHFYDKDITMTTTQPISMTKTLPWQYHSTIQWQDLTIATTQRISMSKHISDKDINLAAFPKQTLSWRHHNTFQCQNITMTTVQRISWQMSKWNCLAHSGTQMLCLRFYSNSYLVICWNQKSCTHKWMSESAIKTTM